MVKLVNRAKMSTATTGTGTITLGSAVDGFQTFAAAGVANADTVRYAIEDGFAWEIGTGTYTATGTTLTRTVIESSNSDAPINLSGNALVFLTVAGQDIVPADGGTFTGPLAVEGKVAIGDELGNANLSNTLNYATNLGVSGYRPINLIDSAAGIKISRPNDGGNGAFVELQEWDSTITTLYTRALIVGEGGDLLYRNLTTGGGDHIFQGVDNAEAMRITSTGNVGIGTSSPSGRLEVHGVGEISRIVAADSASNFMSFRDATGRKGYFGYDGTTDDMTVANERNGFLRFLTNGSTRATITSAGDVGIGNTTPTERLHVTGNIIASGTSSTTKNILRTTSGQIEVRAGNTTSFIDTDFVEATSFGVAARFFRNTNTTGAKTVRFHRGDGTGSEDARIGVGTANTFFGLGGGNVGIGTTGPTTLLQVAAPAGTGSQDIFRLSSAAGGSFQIRCDDLAAANPSWTLFTNASEPMAFAVAATEVMRLTPTGNVGIGTSSPDERLHVIGSAKLDLGSATANPRLYLDHDSATDDANYIQLNRGDAGLEVVSEDNVKIRTNNTERLRITSAGNVLIGTTSDGASKLRVVGLPTSSAGLSAGDIWNDGGTLKIV